MDDDQTLAAPAASAPVGMPAQIGRYRVVRELGRGGMGVVLLAHDPVLDREVALKLLRASDDTQRALLREAQTMARLAHPNIVTVHDVGLHEGRTFVAMERVVGGTLRWWLAERRRHVGQILDTFAQAGEGLAAAHAAGLVHCDFKPDNVLIGDDGRVRVSDFGLATRSGNDGDEPNQGSSVSTLRGTPGYMSPEQAEVGALDARTDQFSFCVALFEALHGIRPFGGETLTSRLREIRAQRFVNTPSQDDLPSGVTDALRRGLALRPDDRYPTMEALLGALRAARRRGGLVLPPAERIAALWNAGTRDAVRARFHVPTLPFVGQTIEDVERQLERHLSMWLHAAEQAQTMAAEDPFWFADAVAHAERSFQELATFVGVLEYVDPVQFANAYRAELPLRPLPEYQLPDDAPIAHPRPPRSPARRRVAELIRSQAIRASMLGVLRVPEALTLAHDATAQAERLGDGPTLAEALLTEGIATIGSGLSAEAGVTLLKRARAVGEESGYALVAARAAIELARAYGGLFAGVPTALADPEDVGALVRYAQATLDRLGAPLRPSMDLAVAEAGLQLRQGQHAAADVTATRALDRLAQVLGREAPERVVVLVRRAVTRAELDDRAGAVCDAQEAVDTISRALGPNHPGAAYALDFLGHFLLLAGRLTEARGIYDRLAAVLDSTPHADGVRRAWCDNKRGEIALRAGDTRDAPQWFEAALERLRARGPQLHLNVVAGPLDYLALALWLNGDLERARAACEEAWTLSRDMSPPPVMARFVRAVLLAHDQRFTEAHETLDALERNKERLMGSPRGLTTCVPVWRARVLLLEGQLAEALTSLDLHAAVTPECDRERLEVLADRAHLLGLLGAPETSEALATAAREAEQAGLSDMPYLRRVLRETAT